MNIERFITIEKLNINIIQFIEIVIVWNGFQIIANQYVIEQNQHLKILSLRVFKEINQNCRNSIWSGLVRKKDLNALEAQMAHYY